jgi:crossover junction endodeoxyribonuclease RuvC
MIILGVDPGTLVTGYGVIETHNGTARVLVCGSVNNTAKQTMPIRLQKIYDELEKIIRKYKPDEFAIETAFYGKNAQSALKLGHARGVAMLAAVRREIPTSEYSPREVKKAIVGKGTASKEQVQYMVQSLLRLKERPEVYDVTDALAVAICHMHRRGSSNNTFKSWKTYLSAHPEKIARRRTL